MASKVPQLQAIVKNARAFYKKLMEDNKHYVKDPPTVERCQLLSNQLFYTRLASIPKRYEAFWEEVESLKNLMKSKPKINIENGGVVALFGIECYAWFCGGEIIGRGFKITGYHV
ncbi:Mitochondrial ATP synthase subunit G protein [Euphorbia peplus]|nr:Mitochondrial ATP synthase subunit G protein [Euphorbia peplus]